MITLADLLQTLSVDQVTSTMTAIMVANGIPADKWRAGGVASSLRKAWATIGSNFTTWQGGAIASGFLDWATGGWLTLVAYYTFNTLRLPATFASGALQMVNGGGGVYTFGPNEVVALYKVGGVAVASYQNTVPITLNPGDTITPNFQATVIGTVASAPPGGILTLETTLPGVTVTNLQAFEGYDGELDPDLRTRARQKQATVSPNGPSDAYEFVAKTAATSSPITRVQVLTDKLTGIVTLYIANAAGTPSGADIDIVDALIQRTVVPLCITCNVLGATPVVIAVTSKAWIQNTALSAAQAEAAIGTQLATFLSQVPIGGVIIPPDSVGKVRVNALEVQIAQATPGVVDTEVDLPASDFVLSAGQVPQLGPLTTTVYLL